MRLRESGEGQPMTPRRILLGVCGGISAYKSCELVREFQRRGCEVRVIMTDAAQQFVTKVTFEALTGSTTYTDLFGDGAFGTAHIEVAKWADAVVIAPLTANTLSRLVQGGASDFLSTAMLAFRGPMFLAPAMNTGMWEHPAVQNNIETIQSRGAHILPPGSGELACGDVGAGRMMEPADIARQVLELGSSTSSIEGKRVVITAGPTREYLDPVRFISSPSSGKMGLAVAQEGMRRGAEVTIVHGPISEPLPQAANSIGVTSAQEMANAVEKSLPADIFIGTAAVADYRAEETSAQKMKKSGKDLAVSLKPNPDILTNVVQSGKVKSIVVGFAAETENVVPNAKLKLEAKKLDLIVGNEVRMTEKGFEKDRTSVQILDRKGNQTDLQNVSKDEVARALWTRVEELLSKTNADRS